MKHPAARSLFLACALALTLAASVQALTITPTWDSTITADTNASTIETTINQAISVYESTFSNPINVNITFAEMTTGLGQSSTSGETFSYAQLYGALQTDLGRVGANANQTTALANLPSTEPAMFGSATLFVSTALARTLNLDPSSSAIDSTISLNTGSMNFTRTSIDPLKYDLKATVEHEIDEALGLGSGLPNGGGAISNYYAEDLYRYTAEGARTFITTGDDAYLSIDGGHTDLARFNQNAGADTGGDYGDWSSDGSPTPQVQDAFGNPGGPPNTPDLGTNEITALNVLGYNLTAVPEPAVTALFFGCFALLFCAVGQRRRKRGARDHAALDS